MGVTPGINQGSSTVQQDLLLLNSQHEDHPHLQWEHTAVADTAGNWIAPQNWSMHTAILFLIYGYIKSHLDIIHWSSVVFPQWTTIISILPSKLPSTFCKSARVNKWYTVTFSGSFFANPWCNAVFYGIMELTHRKSAKFVINPNSLHLALLLRCIG